MIIIMPESLSHLTNNLYDLVKKISGNANIHLIRENEDITYQYSRLGSDDLSSSDNIK